MNQNKIAWLHLSDLHMQQAEQFDRNMVLSTLFADIKALREAGHAPDLVFFTGDVAYRGTSHEYALAAAEFFDPLLIAAGVSKERLFIVPGNHDVNRRRTALVRNPLPSLQKEEDIARTLSTPDEREILFSPQADYKHFVRTYLSQPIVDEAFLGFGHRLSAGNRAIGISGLNSAWLSGFNKAEDGTVDDPGHLAIGELQVRRFLRDDIDLHIVLMHHPLECLMEIDRFVVQQALSKSRAIIVHGHHHRANLLLTTSLDGELITIPAGAVFDGRKSPNGYNFVELDLTAGVGTIHLRRYNDRRNEWQKDTESTGDTLNGAAPLRLLRRWGLWALRELEHSAVHRSLADYERHFTSACQRDLESLNLTQDELVSLVQNEFRNHVNYFIFDLEDYPLPVRGDFIVYLNKVEKNIEFRGVVRCTKNEAKLTQWNDVLTLYRRATRLAYREDPTKIVLAKGLARRVCELHEQIIQRMQNYFVKFESLPRLDIPQSELADVGMASPKVNSEEVYFRMRSSTRACEEALHIGDSVETGDITVERAVGLMVGCMEQSLQHIHKLILLYSPSAD